VVELLIEQWKIMTSSAGCLSALASSKTETDLKSDVIPLQFRNQKRCDVFELLLEQWKIMTSSAGCRLPVRSGTDQNNPYPKASSKTEPDLKSDVIPLHFRNQKRCDVVELLIEQ